MIRSVGVGGSQVQSQTQSRKQQIPTSPFPKITGVPQEPATSSETASRQVMAGVKPTNRKSLLDEVTNVTRRNADGDVLQVSKKAIALAKDYWL